MCVFFAICLDIFLNESLDVGAAAPFTVRPSDLGGVNYALIAIQSPPSDTLEGDVRFRDGLAAFPRDIANWRDYYDWISTDQSTTFYNVRSLLLRCSYIVTYPLK
jgi:hypothetical protein